MSDLISRQAVIKALCEKGMCGYKQCNAYPCEDVRAIEQVPTIDEIYGFKMNHLAMIARVMQKEGIDPKEAVTALQDADRLIHMIINEQNDIIKRTVEEWKS